MRLHRHQEKRRGKHHIETEAQCLDHVANFPRDSPQDSGAHETQVRLAVLKNGGGVSGTSKDQILFTQGSNQYSSTQTTWWLFPEQLLCPYLKPRSHLQRKDFSHASSQGLSTMISYPYPMTL